ncbi:MAG: NAD(P)-dependent alcohol dehydrogenase [Sphingomonadales bacterium]
MKAIELQKAFGLENLVPVTRPEEEPGPGQVKLRMAGASINFRDLMIVNGLYNPKLRLPVIPLSDGVGEVVAVGDGVSRVAVGDRVTPLFHQGWLAGKPVVKQLRKTLGSPLPGVLQEFMVLSEEGVAKVPGHLSDLEAATLPCAALTAWSSLVGEGDVIAGDTVVVQGTGGVSLFALQFARILGARTIVTSSSDEKLDRARDLGADHVINYKTTPEWSKAVLDATDGQGADHIIEVGGAGTIEQSLRAIRVDGQISVIGVLSGVAPQLPLTMILMKHVRMQGIMVGHRDSFEQMVRAIETHRLRPVIDRTFAFDDVVGALEYMASARHFGKICLEY